MAPPGLRNINADQPAAYAAGHFLPPLGGFGKPVRLSTLVCHRQAIAVGDKVLPSMEPGRKRAFAWSLPRFMLRAESLRCSDWQVICSEAEL